MPNHEESLVKTLCISGLQGKSCWAFVSYVWNSISLRIAYDINAVFPPVLLQNHGGGLVGFQSMVAVGPGYDGFNYFFFHSWRKYYRCAQIPDRGSLVTPIAIMSFCEWLLKWLMCCSGGVSALFCDNYHERTSRWLRSGHYQTLTSLPVLIECWALITILVCQGVQGSVFMVLI